METIYQKYLASLTPDEVAFRTNSEKDAHHWDRKRIHKEMHTFLHPTKALPSRKFQYFSKIRFESREGHRVMAIWPTAVRMEGSIEERLNWLQKDYS